VQCAVVNHAVRSCDACSKADFYIKKDADSKQQDHSAQQEYADARKFLCLDVCNLSQSQNSFTNMVF
jgi:hypothetical protein